MVLPAVGPISSSAISDEFLLYDNPPSRGISNDFSFQAGTYLPSTSAIPSQGQQKGLSTYYGRKTYGTDWAAGQTYGSISSTTIIQAVATDAGGNVYVTGSTIGSCRFYNSDNTSFFSNVISTVNSAGSFIAKYSPTGPVLWIAKQIGSTGATVGYGICVDSGSNVYATGSYTGTMTLYNASGSAFTNKLLNAGSTDVFVVKYNGFTGDVTWAARAVSAGGDLGLGIATDAGSNVYVTGQYTGTLTLYSASGLAFSNTFGTLTGSDVFIAKYNGFTGDVLWGARAGSAGADIGYGIVTDAGSNVYVTGQYTGTMTLYNSSGTTFSNTLGTLTGSDVFIAKYNGFTGDVTWAARAGSAGTDTGYGIATDAGSNVYLTGIYVGTLTLYNSSGTAFSNTLGTLSGSDVFIAKYNGFTGDVTWAARAGSAGGDVGFGITTDAGSNVYLTGTYGGTLTLYNSSGSAFSNTLAQIVGQDVFISKYSGITGDVTWAARAGSTGDDIGYAIATDAGSNVYLTGYYNSTLTLYNSSTSAFSNTQALVGNAQCGILAKYDTNTGSVLQANRVGTPAASTTNVRGIACDPGGNIFTTGDFAVFYSPLNPDGSFFANTLTSIGSSDVFITKYSSTGNVLWTALAGSTGADLGLGIATDAGSNVYLTGQYNATLTLYNSSGSAFSNTLALTGSGAIFVAKYNGFTGDVAWAARAVPTSTATAFGIAADSGSNVYVTGQYTGTATLYSGSGLPFSNTLAQIGGQDVFLVKYNGITGDVTWVARAGSTTGTDIGYGIAIDAGSNVYLTGQYSGIMNFYNSSTSAFSNTLAQIGFGDIFIAKYNGFTGNVSWAARAGSAGGDVGYGITTDLGSNVYVTGQYAGAMTLYNSSGTAFSNVIPLISGTDVFVAKYNGFTGDVSWAVYFGSVGFNDLGYGITVDKYSNVYASCGGMVLPIYVTNASKKGVWKTDLSGSVSGSGSAVLCYNSFTGDFINASYLRTAATASVAYCVTCSPLGPGRVITGGNISTQTQIVLSARPTYGTTANSSLFSCSGYVSSYNFPITNQDYWASVLENPNAYTVIIRAVTTDPGGNVYTTGYFQGHLNSYNSDNTTFFTNVYTRITQTIFINKYSPTGVVLWSARAASPYGNLGYGITTDAGSNVYITGQYLGFTNGPFIFYNASGSAYAPYLNSLSGALTCIFIAKYNGFTGDVSWVARGTVGSVGSTGYTIATDPGSNVYISGYYNGTLTLYSASGLAFSNTFGTLTGSDVFIAKYNGFTGDVLWGARAGSAGADIGYGIVTDAGSNVYVTGQYTGTMTLYNSSGTTFSNTLGTLTGSDVFIAKYNGFTGNVTWAARAGSAGADIGYGIVTDSGSNVYVTGQYTGTMTLYNSSGTTFSNTLGTLTGSDVFIAKYNGFTGDVTWAARAGSAGGDVGYGITTDPGSNVYVTGYYNGTMTLYNSSGTAFSNTLGSLGSNDIFISKYSGITGDVTWVGRAGSVGSDIGYGIATDLGSNVYVGGQYFGTLTLYNSDTTSFANTLAPTSTNNSFLAKYDTNSGSVISANSTRSNVSASSISVLAVAYDATSSNIYVAGSYNGVFVAYDQTQNPVFTPTPVPVQSSFLAKYTPNGQILWFARQAAVTTATGQSVKVDPTGNVYMTGQYTGTMTIYNSSGSAFSNTLTNAGSSDVFILKYNSAGNVIWAARAGSTGNDIGYAIATDAGSNVYVAGNYTGLMTIYNSSGTFFSNTLALVGGQDGFLFKYNGFTGDVTWVTRIASSAAGNEFVFGVAADISGNVYITGQYSSTALTLYNSNKTSFANTFATIGTNDAFVAKYNGFTGDVIWGARSGSVTSTYGYSIETDSGSNVYVTGQYGGGTMIFYNSSTSQFANTLPAIGGTGDIFTVKYDGITGNVLWAARAGTTGPELGTGIAVDGYSNVYLVGQSSGTLIFYNASKIPFFKQILTLGGQDGFVAKYNGFTGDVLWAANCGAAGTDSVNGIAIDPLGSQIYIGGVHGTTQPTFYDSNGEPYLVSATGSTVAGAFISRVPINL